MVWLLIVGLSWLALVKSEVSLPTNEADASTSTSSSSVASASPKTKRYLSHQHSPPCPPFYPHFGMHTRMHDTRPYGPPAYPKNEVDHQHYVHQAIQYSKPEYKIPINHYPVVQPPNHHYPAVNSILKQPDYYYYQHRQPEHPPMLQPKIFFPKEPVFAYAPAYPKPMPAGWPIQPEMKKYYPATTQISYHRQPAIVYKPEAPKCSPCQTSPHSHATKPLQPIFSYLKIPPPLPVQHEPAKIYLPTHAHQSIVKPCAK